MASGERDVESTCQRRNSTEKIVNSRRFYSATAHYLAKKNRPLNHSPPSVDLTAAAVVANFNRVPEIASPSQTTFVKTVLFASQI